IKRILVCRPAVYLLVSAIIDDVSAGRVAVRILAIEVDIRIQSQWINSIHSIVIAKPIDVGRIAFEPNWVRLEEPAEDRVIKTVPVIVDGAVLQIIAPLEKETVLHERLSVRGHYRWRPREPIGVPLDDDAVVAQ